MGNLVLSELQAGGPRMRNVSLPRGRHLLHTMPTSAGYDLVEEPPYDWDGRRRGDTPFVVLQHTLSGRGNLGNDGRHYRLEAGATISRDHCPQSSLLAGPGDRWEFFFMVMSGQDAVRIHQTIISVRTRSAPVGAGDHAGGPELCGAHAGGGRNGGAGVAHRLCGDHGFIRRRPGSSARTHRPREPRHGCGRRLHPRAPRPGPERSSPGPDHWLEPRAFHPRLRRASRKLAGGNMCWSSACGTPHGFSRAAISRSRLSRSRAGSATANYFAKAFRRTFGVSPTEFRTTGMYATRR
jgi:hypothetical protein